MQDILTVKGLTRNYECFSLKDISFSLPSGSIMGLMGDNGAGKTTILKLLLNLIRRDAGEITIFGKDNITHEREIKQQIGVVFDECHFSDLMRPVDLGKVFSNTFSSWDSGYYQSLLNQFSLPPKGAIKSLSRGMKMKLTLACALAHHPTLLLLDEATGGLDPVARNELLDILLDYIQDERRSVLLSSHITTDLERICDTIGYLHQGRMLFYEEKDTLLDRLGVLHCKEEQLKELSPDTLMRVRRNQFGCDALINDRSEVARRHPDWMIDPAALDDMMVFYAKGEQK